MTFMAHACEIKGLLHNRPLPLPLSSGIHKRQKNTSPGSARCTVAIWATAQPLIGRCEMRGDGITHSASKQLISVSNPNTSVPSSEQKKRNFPSSWLVARTSCKQCIPSSYLRTTRAICQTNHVFWVKRSSPSRRKATRTAHSPCKQATHPQPKR